MAVSSARVWFTKTENPNDTLTPITLSSGLTLHTLFVFAQGADNTNPQFDINSSVDWMKLNVFSPQTITSGGVEYVYVRVTITAQKNIGTTLYGNITATATDSRGLKSPVATTLITKQGEQGDTPIVQRYFYIPDNEVIVNNKINATYDGGKFYTFEVKYSGYDKDTLEGMGDAGVDVQILSKYDNYAVVTVALQYDNTGYNSITYQFSLGIKPKTSTEWKYIYVDIVQEGMTKDLDDTAYIQFGNPYYSTDYTEKGKAANPHIQIPYFIGYVHPTAVTLNSKSAFVYNYQSDTATTASYSIQTPRLNNVGDYSSGYGYIYIGIDANNTNLKRDGYITLKAQSMISGNEITGTLYLSQDPRPSDIISLETDELILPAKQNSKIVSYTKGSTGVIVDSVVVSSAVWMSVVSEPNINRFTLTVRENTDPQQRKGMVTITSHLNGETTRIQTILNVTQVGIIAENELPIWKDNYISIESDKLYVDYKFKIGNKDVYVGRAFTKDGVAVIKTNDILVNFMEESLHFNDGTIWFNQGGYVTADIFLSNDDWNSEYYYNTIVTYNDWSYRSFEKYGFTYPISDVLDKRQFCTLTVFDSLLTNGGTTVKFLKRMIDGTTESYGLNVSNEMKTVVSSLYDVNKISYGWLNNLAPAINREYKVEMTCNEYCLYYKNKVGGWDSCLFSNVGKQIDKIKINSYQGDVNAGSIDFGTTHYQKDLTRTWQLKSGRLTDAQSKIFSEHLLSTNKAYLHIFETDEIVPVNITDTTINHLTRANNSRKTVIYTINVEDSQQKKVM